MFYAIARRNAVEKAPTLAEIKQKGKELNRASKIRARIYEFIPGSQYKRLIGVISEGKYEEKKRGK